MKANRQETIKGLFRSKGEVKLKELEEMFPDCSSMTLRRDIKLFEEQGLVKRTRGGAVAMSNLMLVREDDYPKREIKNTAQKQAIARRAAEYFEAGCSIYVDNGSTMMLFAQALPDEFSSILTTGINIAMELMKKKNPIVNIVGGQLSRESFSTTGSFATQFINSVNIDIAFAGSSVFSLENGLSCGTYLECEVKREVMRRARRCIALLDSSKFGRNMPFTFAQWDDIDILITDANLPSEAAAEIERHGVTVVYA